MDATSVEGSLLSLILVGQYPGVASLYVAGGNNCSIWRSNDGVSWTAAMNTLLPNCTGAAAVYALHYADGLFMAVGSLTALTTGCGIWTSPDAVTWTQRTCAGNAVLRSVTSGVVNGKRIFVAGATSSSNTNQVFSVSIDGGVTWTDRLGPTAAVGDYVGSLAFQNGIFHAGITNNSFLTKSLDGGASWNTAFNTALNATATTFPALIATDALIIAHLQTVGPNPAFVKSTDNGSSFAVPIQAGAAGTKLKAGAYSPGLDTLVLADVTCSMRTSKGLNSFDAATSMGSACTTINIDWYAVLWDASLNQFVAAGNTNGGLAERFGVSRTGLTDAWSFTTTNTGTNQINALTHRPYIAPSF